MATQRRTDLIIPFLTVLMDAVAIEAAFLAAYELRFASPLTSVVPVTLGYPPLSAYLQGSAVVIPIWLWIFKARGMYRPRRNVHFSDEFFAIARLVGIGLVVIMAIAFFYRTFSYSRLVVILVGLLAVVTVGIGRYLLLKFERWWYRSGHDVKSVVIVGATDTARRISEKLLANPSMGYAVRGYFADEQGRAMEGLPAQRLGSVQDTPEHVAAHGIDVVLIALGDGDYKGLTELIRRCEGLHTELMMVPNILDLMTSHVHIQYLEGIPFLGIKGLALSTWNQVVKRAFDLISAGIILLVVSPVLAVIALAVKLSSPGPVLYRQERIGLDGESFALLKFRSMRTDAERATGPVWTQKDDPRATRIGRFLRRFSLDELPQLLNVLKGDMSIVGPRPERPHFVRQFTDEVPRYRERHRVKTGMTGWAQVNGLRGNAPITERTQYDIYYVENWSLVFDLKIILKTVRAVLFGSDAY